MIPIYDNICMIYIYVYIYIYTRDYCAIPALTQTQLIWDADGDHHGGCQGPSLKPKSSTTRLKEHNGARRLRGEQAEVSFRLIQPGGFQKLQVYLVSPVGKVFDHDFSGK